MARCAIVASVRQSTQRFRCAAPKVAAPCRGSEEGLHYQHHAAMASRPGPVHLYTAVHHHRGEPSMPQSYEAIVIGTGQSGPALARRLAAAGRRVAIVERKRFGGTCVNVGCIPTKTLIASAQAAHVARRAAEFGVVLGGGVSVDMKAVKARKDGVVRASNEGVEKSLRRLANATVHTGHARLVGANAVQVGEQRLEAHQIFLNVGARASVPPIPGIETVPYLTNSSSMEVDFLPAHLVILGGSYIGLEFGQMYRRFGSQVTIIN